MLIVLPPSEGKTDRHRGRPLAWDDLSFPALNEHRRHLVTALESVSAGPRALDVLGVGPSLADQVRRNTHLRSNPAVPVRQLYTGVLYDALDLTGATAAARRRAASRLLVVSALWGALRTGDQVPSYRLSMDVDLPGAGPLATYWRSRLAPVLDEEAQGRLVVDCRSSTYAAAWRPAGTSVAVRVLRERDGRRSVVSHMAKQTRGLVARHLLTRRDTTGTRDPGTPEELAAAVAESFPCELSPGRGGRHTLDVVLRD